MSSPPRRSLHRSFLSLANDLPAALLAGSLVFNRLRACRLPSASLFLQIVISLTPLTHHDRVGLQKAGLLKGYAAAPRIAHFVRSLAAPLAASLISLSRPLRRSPHRSFVSLARRAT
jgi:hypothetical protein